MRASNFQFYNATTVPQQVMSANNNRVLLHIQNKSGGSIYIRFGSTINQEQSVNVAIEIPANGDLVYDVNCPTESLWMVGDDVLIGNNCVIFEVSSV